MPKFKSKNSTRESFSSKCKNKQISGKGIDPPIFASYWTHAMIYFASLGIFMRQGRRTQGNKITVALMFSI